MSHNTLDKPVAKGEKTAPPKNTGGELDFGKTPVPKLFSSLFFPTLIGLLAGSILNIADGIFVGRGVGSNALAAVNIAAPIFLISTGISLLFASGVSVAAGIHLGRGETDKAKEKITLAFCAGTALIVLIALFAITTPSTFCKLFGGNEELRPLVNSYLSWVAPGTVLYVAIIIGMFVIRLDGSPRFAMMMNVIMSATNILLDYVFVFPLHMGIKGAAIATTISTLPGMGMVMWYFLRGKKDIGLCGLSLSGKKAKEHLADILHMARLGAPTFIAETAICCMMIVGNFMFMKYFREDGVAAFGVACYLFPLVFMFGNSIANSLLPIVSYNLGQNNLTRIRATFRLSLFTGLICGLTVSVAGILFGREATGIFLDTSTGAYKIGAHGLPLFSSAYVLFTLNIVIVGYLQGLGKFKPAALFMLLRGYILVIPAFLILPGIIGPTGLWIAVSVSEGISLVCEIFYLLRYKRKLNL